MPQVAVEVRRARAAALREAAARRKRAWLAGKVGTVSEVLVERPGDRGHDGQFAEVRVIGSLAPVLPVRAEVVEAPSFSSSECESPVSGGKNGPSTSSGRTEGGGTSERVDPAPTVGSILPVRITSAHDTYLEGIPA